MGAFSEALHPRGYHGRFGKGASRSVKVTGRTKQRDAAASLTGSRRRKFSVAEGTARLFANPKGKRAGSVVKWEPGIYGGKDAQVKFRYDKGKRGAPARLPDGTRHQPIVREAGFRAVSHKPLPPGSVMAALKKAKGR